MKDKLTPLQRFALYNQGGVPDRLPCVPIVGNTAARVVGCKVGEFRGNGPLIAKAQVAAYRRFGYDVIRVFTDLYSQAEAMGAHIHYPEDETAYWEAPAIASAAEIDKLRPADPHKDGHLPDLLEAMKITIQEVGGEVPVNGALTGPLTVASFLIGAESLLPLFLREKEAAHRLLKIATEACLLYAEAILETGCIPSLTDAMCSSTVISPRLFREFGKPYLTEVVKYVHSRGKAVTLHICGKTSPIWSDMADTGADCLSIDNAASLAEAKAKVGDRVRLMGNIPPSEIMLLGTPEQVRTEVRERIRQAGDSPKGLIIASGCSLPVETPFQNIDAMLDAVREYGFPTDEAGKLKIAL